MHVFVCRPNISLSVELSTIAGSEKAILANHVQRFAAICSDVQRGLGSSAGTKQKVAGTAVVAEIPTLANRLSSLTSHGERLHLV